MAPRFARVAPLAALDHRRGGGEGRWLDISQAEAGIQFLAAAVAHGAAIGERARAAGNRDPQFACHPVAVRKADEVRLDRVLEAWTHDRRADEVEHALRSIGVPAHEVATSADPVATPSSPCAGTSSAGRIRRAARACSKRTILDSVAQR